MFPLQKRRSACADKNDALGWTCGASFSILGRTLGIRTDDSDLLEEVLGQLPPQGKRIETDDSVDILYSLKKGGPGKRRGTRNYFVLYEGWTRLQRSHDGEAVVRDLVDRWVASIAISLHMATVIASRGLVMEREGRALAILGASDGLLKDSLDYYLQQGFGEVSQRALLFNLQGDVLPLPEAIPEHEDLDYSETAPKFRLDEIIFVEDVPSPEKLSSGQGVLKFLKNGLGNATVVGELSALSQGFQGALCRVAPQCQGLAAITSPN